MAQRGRTPQPGGNYVQVFHEAAHGSGVFPEAKTLLAATAEANNFNAVELGVKRYKNAMDPVCVCSGGGRWFGLCFQHLPTVASYDCN